MAKTKITVKIVASMLRTFDTQLDALHMKRDAFLNSMLLLEIPNLEADLKGRRLSSQAKRYIAGALKRLGTKQVNVSIDHATAKALKAVVTKTNIVRDAFINRLIMLLRSSDVVLKYLELPQFVNSSSFEGHVEPMPTSPLKAIEAVHSDPLYYLRVAAEERSGSGLYLIDLPQTFIGLSCFLDDSHIPGTDEFAIAQKESNRLLRELEAIESEAFQKSKVKGK
jgi:hypothetical protein